MISKESIKVFAPASCANVSCGFDILGFALEKPGDEVILHKSNKLGISIREITGDHGKLPHDVKLNTASVAINSIMHSLDINYGVEITIHKRMSLYSGLGSSAASSVAAVYGLNALFNLGLSKQELIYHAMQGEFVASKAIHADNVAPSMIGGFTLIRSYSPLDIVQIPSPTNLYYTIIHPDLEVSTKIARQILKKQVFLADMITQTANLGGLIAGLCTNDYKLIGRSLNDVIVEPIRKFLIPKFDELKDVALNTGALGFGISGSGPSLFTLNDNLETAIRVGQEMQKTLKKYNLTNQVYSGKINATGAIVVG